MVKPLWKTVQRFLETLNIKKTIIQNDICTPIFREALFIIELTKMSTDRKMKTKWYIYTSEYYSVMTQNEIMILAAAWMDREIIIRTEASQREKDKYRRLSCTDGIDTFTPMN